MIDIHCHILPGTDDGPQEMSESLGMLRMAAKDGITDIVATPHISSVYQLDPDRVKMDIEKLRKHIADEGIDIKIHYGFEVQLSKDIISKYSGVLQDITINGDGKYLLLEMPFMDYPLYINDIIDMVIERDIIPIIVHPLRNARILTNTNLLQELKNKGVVLQFNKNAVMDGYQIKTFPLFCQLMRKGLVDVVASDAHSIDIRRPTLRKSYKRIARKVGVDAAETLFVSNPSKILKGEMTEEIHLNSNGLFDKIKNILNL